MPNLTTISLKQWIYVSSIIMAVLVLGVLINFAGDNQSNIAQEKGLIETKEMVSGFKEFKNRDKFLLWLVTLDEEIFNTLDKKSLELPACLRHFVVNKMEEIPVSFNTQTFWFELPNQSQVEFSKNGNIYCYVPVEENSLVMRLVPNCGLLCPDGIDDLREGNLPDIPEEDLYFPGDGGNVVV